MTESKLQNLPIVSSITFIIGLVIIIFSPIWGRETAYAFLRLFYGGSMGSDFLAILQGSINAYGIIGAVLLFLGGSGYLLSLVVKRQKE